MRHWGSGEPVALKVVEKQPMDIRGMLPQLHNEVRIQAALRHRHILRLLSSFDDEAYVYLLLEHCSGGCLQRCCEAHPWARLPQARAARYLAQILQVLLYIIDSLSSSSSYHYYYIQLDQVIS